MEQVEAAAAAVGMTRVELGNAGAGRRFYGVVNRLVVNPVARAMGIEASATRLEIIGSQLVGLAMLRYVLEVEPMASLSIAGWCRCSPHPCVPRCRATQPSRSPWRSSRSSPGEPVDCRSTCPARGSTLTG